MSKRSEYNNLEQKLHFDEICVINDKYLLNRFEQSVKWYIRKARSYKLLYFACSIIGIVLPAVIPIIYNSCLFDDGDPKKCIISILSIVTSISTSLVSLFKAKEKWIHFRFIAEKLQAELSLYAEGVGMYRSAENKNMRFAVQIEKYMSEENKGWLNIMNNKNSRKPSETQDSHWHLINL